MLEGVAPAADPERLAGIRSDLPILLMSGDADPLAGGGPLVQMVGDRYTAAGVHDVTVTLYPEARHEVFNETNRDEVTADLLAWLDRVTQRLIAKIEPCPGASSTRLWAPCQRWRAPDS